MCSDLLVSETAHGRSDIVNNFAIHSHIFPAARCSCASGEGSLLRGAKARMVGHVSVLKIANISFLETLLAGTDGAKCSFVFTKFTPRGQQEMP